MDRTTLYRIVSYRIVSLNPLPDLYYVCVYVRVCIYMYVFMCIYVYVCLYI